MQINIQIAIALYILYVTFDYFNEQITKAGIEWQSEHFWATTIFGLIQIGLFLGMSINAIVGLIIIFLMKVAV